MTQPVRPTHAPFTVYHRRPRRALGWLNRLLVVCLLWLSAAQPSWASPLAPTAPTSPTATITVTNTNDTGAGSLRQAIADASPGDTIVIGVTGTIFLLSGELVISKNLTIQGPGAESLTLGGEFLNRVLWVNAGASVQISGISFKEGLSSSVGGGIYNQGTLRLTNCVVSENSISSSYGGGVYNSGQLTLVNSTIINNSINAQSDANGAAIYSTGAMTITGSLISSNRGGYSIYNSGIVSATNSSIVLGSGGIENRGVFEIFKGDISRHSGMGVQNVDPGNLTLNSSRVSTNNATGIINSGTAYLEMSSVESNGSQGILNLNNGEFYLSSSGVYTNTYYNGHGGGIDNRGSLYATNSTISGNRSTNSYGGGIYDTGSLLLVNTTVAHNISSGYGGGLFVPGSGTVILRNSLIALNTAGGSANSSNINGTVQSQGYNLFGDLRDATILGTDIGHIFGDPNLGPLADNGGPTLTQALLPGSRAIDAGKPTGCRDNDNEFLTSDQRGYARSEDGNDDGSAICDIGAYELGAGEIPDPTPTPTPNPATVPSLTAVTPAEGTSAGGTAITLQGGNFQSGMAVTLDGRACANVVVNSSSNATCTTPSHFPAVVDVAATNPGGQRATLLRGYTYRGSTASLRLPDIIADSGSTVQIPVQASAIDGLMAVSLTVGYDSSKATLRNVTLGALTGGWSVISNTVSSGRVQISMANPGAPAQGDGNLALLHFQVTGSPGQTSPLSIVGVSLNDGTIPTTTTAGSLIVDTLSTLAGQVGYWTDNRAVPGVGLSLTGSNSRTATTDSSGAYSLADVPSGSYTLSPSKSDGVGTDAITSFDASLVLRHSAGAALLSGNAAVVADVDRSGSITPMDASYILRKSVRLIDVPFPGAGRVWDFTPASRAYTPLTGDQSAQNFTALLLGDVSGNWGSGQLQASAHTEAVRLRLGSAMESGLDGHILSLSPGSTPVYSLDLTFRYSPESDATPVVTLAGVTQEFALGSNSTASGLLYIALAGAAPIQNGGDLLAIRWVDQNGNPSNGPTPELVEARVNEGTVAVSLDTGVWGKLFLPTVGR